MYQCDGLFPPVTYLSATVAHVSVKFKMLSPKYEQRILKGHELQQENDKMNMKCQHMRCDAMKSFPMEYHSQTVFQTQRSNIPTARFLSDKAQLMQQSCGFPLRN